MKNFKFTLSAAALSLALLASACGESITDTEVSQNTDTNEVTSAIEETESSEEIAETKEPDQTFSQKYEIPLTTYEVGDVGTATVTLTYNSEIFTEDDSYLENIIAIQCDDPDTTENMIFNQAYGGYAREYNLTITEELTPGSDRICSVTRYYHGFEEQRLIDAYGAERDSELRARREYMYFLKLQECTYLMLTFRVPDDAPEIADEGKLFDSVAQSAEVSVGMDMSTYSKYLLDRVTVMMKGIDFYVTASDGSFYYENYPCYAGIAYLNAMQTDKWAVHSDQMLLTPDYDSFRIDVGGYTIYATESENVIGIKTPNENTVVCYSVPEGTVDAARGIMSPDIFFESDTAYVIKKAELYGTNYAVVKLTNGEICVAIAEELKYTAFYTIEDTYEAAEGQIKLTSFENVLGKDGIQLYYVQGANAAANCFFTLENGVPKLYLKCGKTAYPSGDYLISQQGSMDGDVILYKTENGVLVSENLNVKLQKLLPEAKDIFVYYRPHYIYEGHRGLFEISAAYENYKYDSYIGWLEDGELVIIDNDEITLPEYTYVPEKYTTDEEGRKWLTTRLGTDFALWEEIDPTTLGEEELTEYMKHAREAASSVMLVLNVDSAFLIYSTPYTSQTPEGYYYQSYYNPCNNPAFPTLSSWENYLRRIFSEELADKYMEQSPFAEIDGKLCCVAATRGSETRYVESKITAVTDTDITYIDYVYDYSHDGTGEAELIAHEFHYSKTGDGWRWTEIYNYW